MAEGGYYDSYPNMDGTGNLIPPMNPYRVGPGTEDFGGGGGAAPDKPSGFYQEQEFNGHSNGMNLPVHNPSELPSSQASSHSMGHIQPITVAPTSQDYSSPPNPLAGMPPTTAPLPAVYSQPTNYSVKSESRQHMPPTPPGSPEDSKDLSLHRLQHQNSMGTHGMPGVASASSMSSMAAAAMAAQNLLPKPVPMRRLSEKSISQARMCLSSASSSIGAEPFVDPSYGSSAAIARAISLTQQTQRRPRSEKKLIPEDAKDGKYFERRKRNNNAAKKSRDQRKSREDEIAIRASFLEKENAILRAQVSTLREEANSLRQLLLQKRTQP